MSKLLSIIVPMYNVEKYIEKCIYSLLNQDIDSSEYEIIVINDGTPDSSADIVKKIAENFPNIMLINQNNGGVSTARNTGLAKATGKYILFIDSDDFIEENILRSMLNKADNQQLDMLAYNFRTIKERKNSPRFSGARAYSNKVFTGQEYILNSKFIVMVPIYMFRREFLLENNLKFVPLRHEDEEFTPRALIVCKRIAFFNKIVYNYVIHNGSYMNREYKPQGVMDLLKVMRSINSYIKNSDIKNQKVVRFLKRRVNKLFYITLKRSIKNKLNLEETMFEENSKFNLVHKGIYATPLLPYFLMIKCPKLFIKYYQFNYRLRNK